MNRLAAVVGLAVLFIVGTSVSVSASNLGGETFTWDGSGTNGTFFCDVPTGTMTYGVNRGGIATGPFAGSFNEDGHIAFSGGLVTGWSANFTVRRAGVVVLRGTKSLTAGGAGPASAQGIRRLSPQVNPESRCGTCGTRPNSVRRMRARSAEDSVP